MPAYGTSSSAVSTSASFNVAKPASTASGDLLIAILANDGGSLAISGGSTWTSLVNAGGDFGTLFYRIYYKLAGGSEPTNYTAAQASGADCHVSIIRFTAATGNAPVYAVDTSGQSGTTISTPSITPAGTTDVLLRFVAGQTNNVGSASWTAPASHTLRTNQQSRTWLPGGTATRDLVSGAATGTASFTINTSVDFAVGITIGITSASVDASVDIPAAIAVPAAMPTPGVSAGSSATPAAIAVPAAMPAPGVSAGSSATPATIAVGLTMPLPAVTAEDAEVVTPDTITVVTAMPAPVVQADASAAPATIAVVTAMPPPAVQADAAVTLSTIAVQVAMPRPVVTVPPLPGDRITRWGQIEWNGFLLGEATPYSWQGLEGWRDLPPIISGNVDQPNANGSYPGQPYAGERVINWGTLLQGRPDQIGQLLRDLQMVTGRSQTEEEGALVIWDFADAEPYLVYGHLTNRAPGSIDQQAAQVGLMRGALQWTCSGPEIFSVIRQSLPIPINAETDVLNNGNEASPRVVYRIPGPCSTPQVENLTLDRVFGFDVDIADGEILEIDVKNGNVTIGVVDYLNKLIEGSTSVKDFVLAPGVNRLLWSAETGGTLLNVLWRHSSL